MSEERPFPIIEGSNSSCSYYLLYIMSFEWNLSSGEEVEDFEAWGASAKNNREEPASIVTPPPFAKAPDAAAIRDTPAKDSSSEDDDSVDWEDAGDDGEDGKPAAKAKGTTNLPQAVQIDLSRKEEDPADKKPARKRKRRNKFRIQSLPRDMQEFLWNLTRSHLLSLTSSAVFVSKQCSEEDVLALAHSLLPKAAAAAGIDFPSLCDRIIRTAAI